MTPAHVSYANAAITPLVITLTPSKEPFLTVVGYAEESDAENFFPFMEPALLETRVVASRQSDNGIHLILFGNEQLLTYARADEAASSQRKVSDEVQRLLRACSSSSADLKEIQVGLNVYQGKEMRLFDELDIYFVVPIWDPLEWLTFIRRFTEHRDKSIRTKIIASMPELISEATEDLG